MHGLWGSLAPLIVGSTLVPIQVVITLLLLRSERGRITAVAFVAGMTFVRLVQGVLFGLVFSTGATDSAKSGPGPIVSTLLLVIAVFFLVAALKQLLQTEDADAPPPKWLAMTATMSPRRAALLGAGLLAIGVKFWVLTLGAIAAIGDADLSRTSSILTFLAFVALVESLQIAVLAVAYIVPERSAAVLQRGGTWLSDHNRAMVIVLGLVFGLWFLLKALSGLGVLG